MGGKLQRLVRATSADGLDILVGGKASVMSGDFAIEWPKTLAFEPLASSSG